jgi:hypothetical protein
MAKAALMSAKRETTAEPSTMGRLYDARQQTKLAVVEFAETILKSEADYTVAYSRLRSLMARSEKVERSLIMLTDTIANYDPA